MANDDFPTNHPLPSYLSEHPDGIEQHGSRWFLKTSILVATVTALGVAVALPIEGPASVLASVSAWLPDMSNVRAGIDQPSQPSPTTTTDAPSLPPSAAAETNSSAVADVQPADQNPAEIREPRSADVLKQFQAWAAQDDTPVQIEPMPPEQAAEAPKEAPKIAAPASIAQDAEAPAPSISRPRRIRRLQEARAEIRPVRIHQAKLQAKLRPRQYARAQAPRPAPVAPPQAQPVADPQPSLLQNLGWRN